jgi:predicted alpha/beta-hydrolase family hydrolase
MPITIETIPVESEFGVTIRNKLLLNEARSGRLLVMLPGRGYTNDHPLMHYVSVVGLQNGYDVLRVEYGFQAANLSFAAIEPDKFAAIGQESKKAVELTLARGGYSHVCIAAKSMGTPMAVMMMPDFDVPNKALILLTPVQNAAAMTGDIRTLAVIGTADAAYDAAKTADTDTLTWHVLDGLNHSLEKEGDWRESLLSLTKVTGLCDKFLKV